jgi:hypothetical protein
MVSIAAFFSKNILSNTGFTIYAVRPFVDATRAIKIMAKTSFGQ